MYIQIIKFDSWVPYGRTRYMNIRFQLTLAIPLLSRTFYLGLMRSSGFVSCGFIKSFVNLLKNIIIQPITACIY